MGWLSGYYPFVRPPSTLCCVMLGLGQQTKFLLSRCSLCASAIRRRIDCTAGTKRDLVLPGHFLWALSSQESYPQPPCSSPQQKLSFPPQSLNLVCSFQHSQPHCLLRYQRQLPLSFQISESHFCRCHSVQRLFLTLTFCLCSPGLELVAVPWTATFVTT